MILTLVTRERVNPDGVAFQVPGLTRPLDESIIPGSCPCREKETRVMALDSTITIFYRAKTLGYEVSCSLTRGTRVEEGWLGRLNHGA